MKFPGPLERITHFLQSLFLNGLFTIIPIAATLFFLSFTYNLLAGWLQPLRKVEPVFLQKIPGAEIIIFIIFILIIGALVKFFVITPIILLFCLNQPKIIFRNFCLKKNKNRAKNFTKSSCQILPTPQAVIFSFLVRMI